MCKIFQEKSSSNYIYELTKFHCLISFILWDIANMCIAIAYFLGCDVITFTINLIFLIKPFFYMTRKTKI